MQREIIIISESYKIPEQKMNEILELDLNDINVCSIKELLSQQKIHVDSIIHLKNTPEKSYSLPQNANYPLRSLLCAAVLKKDHELIDYLLSQNADINLIGHSYAPLHIAAKMNDFEIFKKLHHLGADIHLVIPLTQQSPLMTAVETNGSYDIVKYLIEQGVDINAENTRMGWTPLMYACMYQKEVPVVNLLLDNGANILSHQSAPYRSPLRMAMFTRNREVFYLLIARGVDFYPGGAIIYNALSQLEMEFLEYLLSLDLNRTNVNIVSKKNENLLHYGLKYNCLYYDNCKVLLDAGIDVNVENSDGKLAIDYNDNDPNIHHVVPIKPHIKQHIVKLMVAGLPVHQRNQQAVEEDFKQLKTSCLQEVEKMKINKVGESNINFLDVLFKSIHYLALYLKFAGLDQVIVKEKLCSEYPEYGRMIFFKLSKVERRIKYLEQVEEPYGKTLCELGLPDSFVKKLWFYLSNIRLKRFVKVMTTIDFELC